MGRVRRVLTIDGFSVGDSENGNLFFGFVDGVKNSEGANSETKDIFTLKFFGVGGVRVFLEEKEMINYFLG